LSFIIVPRHVPECLNLNTHKIQSICIHEYEILLEMAITQIRTRNGQLMFTITIPISSTQDKSSQF
jgi:hypothetical protein